MWHLPSAHRPTPEPWPGAWLMLLACTVAPRSLSHSKLPVPSTKLLPMAKKNKTEGVRGRGEFGVKREGKTPPRRHFSHSGQYGRLELGNGADQHVCLKFFYDVSHFSTETKYQGISPRSWSLWAYAILKQEPWHFIPNVSPLARITHLLWNQDTCVSPTQALCPSRSLACPKALPG